MRSSDGNRLHKHISKTNNRDKRQTITIIVCEINDMTDSAVDFARYSNLTFIFCVFLRKTIEEF